MAERKNTFILKRSNVAGKIPSSGDLMLGELAINTADVILYASGTTANSILPIGWDRVSRTGDTMTGTLYAPSISATTITGTSLYSDYLQFNTTYTGGTITEGRMSWDENNQTVSIGMHNGVSLQIGQEMYYLVKNQSGATIENGRVVKAAGTLGGSGRILGEYMIADGSVLPKYTLGVATEDILNGDDGYVTEFGLVRGIDTTGSLYGETWNEGDVLWVSPTIQGGLTNIEPLTPNLHIEIAIVIRAAANGSIFVRPHRYPYSHDVQDFGWSGGTEQNLEIPQWDSSLGYFKLTNTPSFNTVSATTYQNLPSQYKTLVLTAGTSYTFTDFKTVNTLSINKTIGSPTTVILDQTPSINDFFVVKDRKGDSVTNNIIVSGGTYTIDGNTSITIKQNNKPSYTFLFDGQEYIII